MGLPNRVVCSTSGFFPHFPLHCGFCTSAFHPADIRWGCGRWVQGFVDFFPEELFCVGVGRASPARHPHKTLTPHGATTWASHQGTDPSAAKVRFPFVRYPASYSICGKWGSVKGRRGMRSQWMLPAIGVAHPRPPAPKTAGRRAGVPGPDPGGPSRGRPALSPVRSGAGAGPRPCRP